MTGVGIDWTLTVHLPQRVFSSGRGKTLSGSATPTLPAHRAHASCMAWNRCGWSAERSRVSPGSCARLNSFHLPSPISVIFQSPWRSLREPNSSPPIVSVGPRTACAVPARTGFQLLPLIGFTACPATVRFSATPAKSRTVGATSVMWAWLRAHRNQPVQPLSGVDVLTSLCPRQRNAMMPSAAPSPTTASGASRCFQR